MARAMKPRPWAQPNTIVSDSKPGSSQNATSAANSPSSSQEASFTHGNRGPAATSRSTPSPRSTAMYAVGSGRQGREDDALLLEAVGRRVALAGARALGASHVAELDAVGKQLGHPAEHDLPCAHVL